MGQASRRAWRLIQEKPCKVFYPFYADLMENQAVELVGRKQQAAALLYGENTGSGLSALSGNDGGNLLAALAAEIGSDNTVSDLRDLFARHTADTDPADSAWFAAEEPAVEVVPAAEPDELWHNNPLLRYALTENTGAIDDPNRHFLDLGQFPKPDTTLAALPPKPVHKRRRKVLDMLAFPADGEPSGTCRPAPVVLIPHPEPPRKPPVSRPLPQPETLQLSLL
jgi:hypothetical protein